MLRIIVIANMLITVIGELPIQGQQRYRSQESGTLLRVVHQPKMQPMSTKIFYYIPKNSGDIEVTKNRNEESELLINERFVENAMKRNNGNLKVDNEGMAEISNNKQVGFYYIYHPNGLLQKVEYINKNNEEQMSMSTSVRYQTVEPIKGPIYTYDPQTLIYRQI